MFSLHLDSKTPLKCAHEALAGYCIFWGQRPILRVLYWRDHHGNRVQPLGSVADGEEDDSDTAEQHLAWLRPGIWLY